MTAATHVDATPVVRALIDMGVTRTQIARAVGCDPQTVLCWLFGLPMNAQRREQWVLKLVEFAADVGMTQAQANERSGAAAGPAEDAAIGALRMLAALPQGNDGSAGERAS